MESLFHPIKLLLQYRVDGILLFPEFTDVTDFLLLFAIQAILPLEVMFTFAGATKEMVLIIRTSSWLNPLMAALPGAQLKKLTTTILQGISSFHGLRLIRLPVIS